MYTPPHAAKYHRGSSTSTSMSTSMSTSSSLYYKKPSILPPLTTTTPPSPLLLPLVPVTPVTKSLVEYNKQLAAKKQAQKQKQAQKKVQQPMVVQLKIVTAAVATAAVLGVAATEFWTDIYKFKDRVALLWNHSLSKDSMVKLLQEQGTIKFNPIEYYRNTMVSHEDALKTHTEAVAVKVLLQCVKYLGDASVDPHHISPANMQCLEQEVADVIEAGAGLSETKKMELIAQVHQDLREYAATKRADLGFKYGFKYKQHVKFLETSLAVWEDDLRLVQRYSTPQYLPPKVLPMMLEGNWGSALWAAWSTTALDKAVKKDAKLVASLPYDSKYFVRWVQCTVACHVLEAAAVESKAAAKALVVAEEKMAHMEYVLRAKLYPLLNRAHSDKVAALELELDLFVYATMKDRILGELQQGTLERDSKADALLLERLGRHDFEAPVALELANMVHAVALEANKAPFLVRMLELFVRSITARGAVITAPTLNVFVEMYTYIMHYLAPPQTLGAEVKKKYLAATGQVEVFFAQQKLDVFQYQMVHLYEHLSPLSHFDDKRPKLDQWQKNVFEMMDRRQNVIVIAPTSSGKTALSTYASLVFQRVLFVVPSPELARQVCGMIRNLVQDNKLHKHISLITEKDTYHDNDATFDILVGTPGALECHFVEQNVQTDVFDYIVFDEIHQLNQAVVGGELERWVKWLTFNSRSHFLALSACVGNAEQLHAWWRQFVPDIALVCCHRRFLQQQKYLWKPAQEHLIKIHPLSVVSLDLLQHQGLIGDDGLATADLAFTPDELYDLYLKLKDHPLFDTMLHPVNYFTSLRLTLETCKEWEWRIKGVLQCLATNDAPFVAQHVLAPYLESSSSSSSSSSSGTLTSTTTTSVVEKLYKLLKELHGKNLLPTILFRLDPDVCQHMFTELVWYLKEEETRVFPFYYEDLQFCNSAHETCVAKEKELHKITIPEKLDVSPLVYIEERKANLRASEFDQFQKSYTERMHSRIYYTKTKFTEFKENTVLPTDIVRIHLSCFKRQIRYYEKELQRVQKLVELAPVNIYKPHPDFTFLDEYITSDHIIEYRQQLMDYLKEEKKMQNTLEKQNFIAGAASVAAAAAAAAAAAHKPHEYDGAGYDAKAKKAKEFRAETYVSYDHPFIIGMERGVILYLNRLPTPFQRVAQSLIATTLIKLAPVTFSDHSLALGINYPIRSVILTTGGGEPLDPIMAHQMIGRAGRRGIDPKGYTIYYDDVDWQNLIREKYLAVRGSGCLDGAIWPMPYLWTNIQDKFELVTRCHLQDYTSGTTEVQARYASFLADIHCLHTTFTHEYNVELLEDRTAAFSCLLRDVYRHKYLGFQAIFVPYLLEEMSRWKISCHKLDSRDKWHIIQVLTAFLNGAWTDACFSEPFRHKIFSRWPPALVATYTTHPQPPYTPIRFEDHTDEQHQYTYWFAVSQLLSTLHSVCKDRRMNTVLSVVFLDIKQRLKKYTF